MFLITVVQPGLPGSPGAPGAPLLPVPPGSPLPVTASLPLGPTWPGIPSKPRVPGAPEIGYVRDTVGYGIRIDCTVIVVGRAVRMKNTSLHSLL